MALHGTPEPNFDAFEVGSTRKQVEIQLGTPTSSKPLEDGKREDTYRYEMGNSSNGGRAAMNFYIDLATLGIWELPGTIIEGMMGHKEESIIVYGADDKVLAIKGYRPPEPSPEFNAAREAQDKYKQPGSK
jgi:outer membrane protein assembly factor BamE (lipoprotein component of BamABCDE complex)